MSERLARASAFALEAEEVYDEVPDQSPRRQLTNLRRVAMRRPDRLVGDASGDAMNRTFWYNGKVFSAVDKEQRVRLRRCAATARHPSRGLPSRAHASAFSRERRMVDQNSASWNRLAQWLGRIKHIQEAG